MVFNPKYGNLAFITLPTGFIAIFSAIFLFLYLIFNVYQYFYLKYLTASAVGLSSLLKLSFNNNTFFINTSAILFISIIFYIISITIFYLSVKMYNNKIKFNFGLIAYYLTYAFIAPFWMIRAVYNAISNTSPD